MAEVSIRELRNQGGAVVDRVSRGETVTVTRDGQPVAELRPVPRKPLPTEELIARHHHLPPVDLQRLRAELDSIIDPRL